MQSERTLIHASTVRPEVRTDAFLLNAVERNIAIANLGMTSAITITHELRLNSNGVSHDLQILDTSDIATVTSSQADTRDGSDDQRDGSRLNEVLKRSLEARLSQFETQATLAKIFVPKSPLIKWSHDMKSDIETVLAHI